MNEFDLLTLISTRTNEFFDQLPGVRDGRSESVHDARVACRRLRELLPLVTEDRRAARAQAVLTEAGRHLGRVRDLDVMAAVLTQKEAMAPAAALAIASARRVVTARLREQRRSLVKVLEQVELGRVAVYRQAPHVGWRSATARWMAAEPPWGAMLRDRIGLRAHRLRTAVDHAAGIYFPNRLHGTRIAVKQLRYVVEVAAGVHAWNPPHLLDDLKKVQALLGTIHDAQVLLDGMQTLVEEMVPRQETSALLSTLDADIARMHARYLGKRDRLMAIAAACERFSVEHTPRPGVGRTRPVVAASAAVAIPALMLLQRKAV